MCMCALNYAQHYTYIYVRKKDLILFIPEACVCNAGVTTRKVTDANRATM